MVSDSSNAVLRRKTSAAREVWQARAMSPAKALKLAFARAADELMDLAVAVSSVETDTPSAEAMLGGLEEGALLILLDGPRGAIGVAAVEFPVVAGLVEMLTMGRVLRTPVETRSPTRTDAAMVAPLLDAAFANLAELLDGPEAAQVAGYRFGVMMENPRMVGLAIEATEFRRQRMQLDIAGAREGEVTLALPVQDDPPPVEEAEDGQAAERAASPLKPVLMSARARLDVVLHRLRMPLSELERLKPGDLVPVPRSALSDTTLEAGPRHRVAVARLGQMNGFRAVLLSPGDGAAMAAGAARGEGAAAPDAPDAAPEPLSLPAEAPEPGDLPDLADLPELGDLPDLGDLPELGGMEAPPDDLPPLGDLPDLGDLPALGDEEDAGDFGAAPMAGLPVID